MKQQNNQEGKNTLEEEIKGILAKLKEMSVLDLATFDVRDYEFRRVVNRVAAREQDLEIEKRNELYTDLEIYNGPCSIVVKTAIGKKWAWGGLDFDYDASLFMNCIYRLAMFPEKSIALIPQGKGNEYKFDCGEIRYRGDTMNSWTTTMNRFFHVKSWRAFLGGAYHDAQVFPEYITAFMNAAYTIGNFLPLPDGLNGPRGTGRSHDYWDLALLCIFNFYTDKYDEHTLKWLFGAGRGNHDERVETCKKWLGGFRGWNDFVEKTCMQDFANEVNGVYGAPKELWKGHFEGNVYPEKDECTEFFTNASCRILARRARIALAVKNRLMKEDLDGLVSRMIGK